MSNPIQSTIDEIRESVKKLSVVDNYDEQLAQHDAVILLDNLSQLIEEVSAEREERISLLETRIRKQLEHNHELSELIVQQARFMVGREDKKLS